MKIRGFLVVLVLAAVAVYFLWIAKTGEKQVLEKVEMFSKVKQEVTKINMDSLSKDILTFVTQEGRTPKDFKELRKYHALLPVGLDGWGTAIKYERLSSDDFRLISAGKDKTFNTSDDIVIDY